MALSIIAPQTSHGRNRNTCVRLTQWYHGIVLQACFPCILTPMQQPTTRVLVYAEEKRPESLFLFWKCSPQLFDSANFATFAEELQNTYELSWVFRRKTTTTTDAYACDFSLLNPKSCHEHTVPVYELYCCCYCFFCFLFLFFLHVQDVVYRTSLLLRSCYPHQISHQIWTDLTKRVGK